MKNKQAYINDYGFLLIKANKSQEPIVRLVEEVAKNRPYNQTCIFNSSLDGIVIDKLPVYHMNEMKYFFGNLFLFDIVSLILTKNCPNILKRYFYANDVPWADNAVGKYKEWKNIFDNENIEIIAANNNIADIYEICWKKPILITENLSYDSISKIL